MAPGGNSGLKTCFRVFVSLGNILGKDLDEYQDLLVGRWQKNIELLQLFSISMFLIKVNK